MSNRKKGFDPLSSLFDAPDPGATPSSSGEDPYGLTEPGRRISVTDSVLSQAVDAGLDLEDAPTEMAPRPEDPALKVGNPGPLRSKAEESEPSFIGELPESDDWTESKPEALYALNQLPVPEPDEQPAPRYGQKRSRVERLAARAVRPKTALEAAREAAREETEEEERGMRTLTERIEALILDSLPGVGALSVQNAKVMDEREVLTALWKSHRHKFLADGEVGRAVAAARVLHVFETAPTGALVAAHAVTDASDYLVWIDLQTGTLVAAFADARAYFAG